jgi:uncharacterized protein
MKTNFVALLSGVLFAVGLGISGMTQPAKIIDFLDVTGHWDPSLMFVMMGAVGTHMFFARRALRMSRPLLAQSFDRAPARDVDRSLLGGAALFGVGWGLGGYCPGPALASLPMLATGTIAFVAAMAVGMLVVMFTSRRASPTESCD